MYRGITAEEVRISGHDGDEINAYLARPIGDGPFPGVGVIHHMPGWDEATTEIARRFAANGYLAVVPNLHYREGPDAAPDDAAAASRAAGGVPDERFLGDLSGALDHLRGLDGFNGKLGVIGYCSGGRQAFLAACSLEIDAAVDCYGAFVVGDPPEGMPLKVKPIVHLAGQLHCPLLGLFGKEDQHPSPEQVDQLEEELKKVGATYEFHRYDDAGHGFFATDREMYRPVAATDGWKKIFDFYGRYLDGPKAGAVMCSYVTVKSPVEGSGKGARGWFKLSEAMAYYDHPYDAPYAHTLNIDFLNEAEGPSARVAVELTADSARQLVRCIEEALRAAGEAAA